MQEDAAVPHPLVTLQRFDDPRLARYSLVLVVEDQQWGGPVLRRRRAERFRQ
jgi:hypothetical protein